MLYLICKLTQNSGQHLTSATQQLGRMMYNYWSAFRSCSTAKRNEICT